MLSRALLNPIVRIGGRAELGARAILRVTNLLAFDFSSNAFKGMSKIDIEKELIKLKRQIGKHYTEGKYDEALRVAVDMQVKVEDEMGRNNGIYASAMNNVALMAKMTADYDRAIATYTEALQIYGEVAGVRSRSYMITLGNLGAAYRSYGEASKGIKKEQLLERAAEALGDSHQFNKDNLGVDHKETLISANHLAGLYKVMNKSSLSEALYRETIDLCTKKLGEWDGLTATLHNNLGLLLKTLGRYDGANTHYREALKIRSKTLGEKHPDSIITMHNIAEMLISKGQPEEAAVIQQNIIDLVGDEEAKKISKGGAPSADGTDKGSNETDTKNSNSSYSSSIVVTKTNGGNSASAAAETKPQNDTDRNNSVVGEVDEDGGTNVDDKAIEEEFFRNKDWLPTPATRGKRKDL